MTTLNFNTKINFNPDTISCRLFNAVENFCYLGGRSFSVLSTTKYRILLSRSPEYRYRCHVQEKLDPPSTMMSTALKVILYATIVIPLIMFIAKICLRDYYIFDTKDWNAEEEKIQNLILKLNAISGRDITANDATKETVETRINPRDPLLMSIKEFSSLNHFIESHTKPEAFENFLRDNALTNKKPRVHTFLCHAILVNNLPLVKYLVGKQSTEASKTLLVNETYRDTPLSLAKNVAMAKYLLDNGAKVNARTMGSTPLESAISSKNDPMIRLFIQRGALLRPFIYAMFFGSYSEQYFYDREREGLSTFCDIVSNKSFKLAVNHPDSIFSNLPIEIKRLIYSFYNV